MRLPHSLRIAVTCVLAGTVVAGPGSTSNASADARTVPGVQRGSGYIGVAGVLFAQGRVYSLEEVHALQDRAAKEAIRRSSEAHGVT